MVIEESKIMILWGAFVLFESCEHLAPSKSPFRSGSLARIVTNRCSLCRGDRQQGNTSAILLEKNRKQSSDERTHALNIQYFLISVTSDYFDGKEKTQNGQFTEIVDYPDFATDKEAFGLTCQVSMG